MRNTVQTIDQTVTVQRDQTKLLAEAVDKARGEASARNAIVEIEPQVAPGDGGAAGRGAGEEDGASDAEG